MDQYDISYANEHFAGVWNRVMPVNSDMPGQNAPQKAETNDEAQLRAFINDEAADCRYYTALACRSASGQARRLFSQLASEENAHMRKLQTSYFILTGDTHCPPLDCPYIPSFLDALRTRYIGETKGAAEYLAAAERAGQERLSDLYRSLAENEKRHADSIAALIEQMMK